MRNGRNFEQLLDQLEGAMDLIDTIGPLTDEAFFKVVNSLQS